MRFIRCARQRFEQNMVIFQYHGCIYYRTTKDVKLGEELLVWYDSRYSQVFGIPVALNESGNRGTSDKDIPHKKGGPRSMAKISEKYFFPL